MRQGVWKDSLTAWAEDNVKIKASKYFSPSGLSTSEFLCGHEIFKVSVVGVDNGVESVRVAFQVVSPFLERRNNQEQLLVKYCVIAFSLDE